jgi:hypothetical protein
MKNGFAEKKRKKENIQMYKLMSLDYNYSTY